MPRGGVRPGAGRPSIPEEGSSWGSRAVSKSVTLTVEDWEWLREIAVDGSVSTAVRALIRYTREPTPNGEPIPGLKYRP